MAIIEHPVDRRFPPTSLFRRSVTRSLAEWRRSQLVSCGTVLSKGLEDVATISLVY
jgi:hypothetical protein